eukprot:COSAG02_NODE_49_length_45106_cov_298.436177_4_plen_79_part_00
MSAMLLPTTLLHVITTSHVCYQDLHYKEHDHNHHHSKCELKLPAVLMKCTWSTDCILTNTKTPRSPSMHILSINFEQQ